MWARQQQEITFDADEIKSGLLLGSCIGAGNLEELQKHKVSSILNCTDDCDNYFPTSFEYKRVRILDFATVRILPLFEDYCAFIHESLAKGSVLVHCMAGASRSSSFVVAYLLWTGFETDVDQAISYCRGKRAVVSPNAGFRQQLQVWAEHVRRKTSPRNVFIDMPGAWPPSRIQNRFFLSADEPSASAGERRAAAWVEHSLARFGLRGADDFNFDSGLLRDGADMRLALEAAQGEALQALGNRCSCATADAAQWAEEWMAGLLEAVVARGLAGEEASASGGAAPAPAPAGAGEGEGACDAVSGRVLVSRDDFRDFVRAKLKNPALVGAWVALIGQDKLDRALLRWFTICKEASGLLL